MRIRRVIVNGRHLDTKARGIRIPSEVDSTNDFVDLPWNKHERGICQIFCQLCVIADALEIDRFQKIGKEFKKTKQEESGHQKQVQREEHRLYRLPCYGQCRAG